jgi:hypothetical protein
VCIVLGARSNDFIVPAPQGRELDKLDAAQIRCAAGVATTFTPLDILGPRGYNREQKFYWFAFPVAVSGGVLVLV